MPAVISPTSPATGRRSRTAWLVATLLAALLSLQVGLAEPASAATPVTYAGSAYPTAGPSPTEDKPQSKLWYNDGSWWALMRVTAGVTIHRLTPQHTWVDTGVVVDERTASTGDALWEGGKLYVASRVSGGALRAIRFSYDAATDTYARDWVKQVGSGGTESMSVARDSLGRLWVAFMQSSPRRVYVAHSTTDENTWTAPFPVNVEDNTGTSDDLAGIIAFGNKIGVMWSDQEQDVMRFAVHQDGADDSTWTLESALPNPSLGGANLADDHLNLKSLTEGSDGSVYAAVKTSRGDAGEPLTDPSVVVLKRSAAGAWSGAVASRVGDKLTRPQIALDNMGRLFVLMSTESGGTVYYKSTSQAAPTFEAGRGTPFVQWPGASINDASTTKQTVNAATGLVVLASDDDVKRYYHGELSLGAAPTDTTAPTAPTNLTGTPTANSVALSWTASTDAVGVTGYRIFRGATQVGTSTGTSYTDTGLTASTAYRYTVSAVDAAANVSPPSAAFDATTGAGPTTPPPGGSVAFVSAASVNAEATSISAPGPAGVQAGDVLLATVSVRGTPAITPPPGWTLVRGDINGNTMRQAVYVKVATGSDASSTWGLNKAFGAVVQTLAYRGVDSAAPVLASAGQLTTGATLDSPAVATAAGSSVITIAGIARQTTLTPQSGVAERSENASISGRYKLTAGAGDAVAAGSTAGPYSTTASGSAAGIAQTVSLRPGSGSSGGGGTPDTTPPTAPTNVTGTPTTDSVALSWTASTDNVGVTGYRIFRGATQVGTSTGTSYTDTGLTASTAYSYSVSAVDGAGLASSRSAPATSVTTLAGEPSPPASSPVSFMGASTATSETTSTSVAAPAGAQAGDVLVAAVSVRGSLVITPPSGWTQVRRDVNGSTMVQAIYTRVATGSDASVWTVSRAYGTVVQVLAYRGVDTAAPVIAAEGAVSTTATIAHPSVATVADSRVITFAGIARTATLAPAAPLAERSEVTTATARYKVTADAADTTTTGTISGAFSTTANGSAGGIGQTVALRPRA